MAFIEYEKQQNPFDSLDNATRYYDSATFSTLFLESYFVDFNGDGKLDYFARKKPLGNTASPTFEYYQQEAQNSSSNYSYGNFKKLTTNPLLTAISNSSYQSVNNLLPYVNSFSFVDIDRDGDLDAFVTFLNDKSPGYSNFDGVDDYIEININEPETEVTHELWFRTTEANSGIFSIVDGTLGNNGSDRHIYLSNGEIKARVWNNETISSTGLNLADGQWHHVAHVIGNSVGGNKLYVDGVLVASGTKTASNFDWQSKALIGFSYDATHQYFDGQIKDVIIWNEARSVGQIQDSFQNSVSSTEDNLLAYYPLNDGTADDYANFYDGTIRGGANNNSNFTYKVNYYRNDGNNNFSEVQAHTFAGINSTLRGDVTNHLAFGDVNNDNRLDAVTITNDGTFRYFLNVNDSYISERIRNFNFDYPFNDFQVGDGTNGNLATPAFTDYDSDGDQDLVVVAPDGQYSAKYHYYRNDGTNSSGYPVFTELKGKENPFFAVKTGHPAIPTFHDVNQDGLKDLVVTQAGKSEPYYFERINPASVSINNRDLTLDGVSKYLTIPDSNDIDFANNENFTVETWIKPDSLQADVGNGDNDVIEKWGVGGGGYPYVIRYGNRTAGSSAGKIIVARYDGSNHPVIVSTSTINDGEFHHIAFVKDGSNLKLYIDGQLEGTTTDTTTGNTENNSPLFVGSRNGINKFKGEIADVRIWDYARQDWQITDDMHNRLTRRERGLVGYYTFDDGTAIDLARNNDGTLNGYSYVAPVTPTPRDFSEVQARMVFNDKAGSDWHIRGTGDFNGDGTDDILWQHNNGQVHYWKVGNGQRVTGANISTPVGSDWTLAGAGDLDSDGDDDLIWQHNTGLVHAWEIENGQRIRGYNIGTSLGADTTQVQWRVLGAGDVDGDGDDDILLRRFQYNRFTSDIYVWEISNKAKIGQYIAFDLVDRTKIQGMGDFNGDGYEDILSNGTVVYEMERGRKVASHNILNNTVGHFQDYNAPDFDSNWQVVSAGDFNYDGVADILWRNSVTQEIATSFMQPGTTGQFDINLRYDSVNGFNITNTNVIVGDFDGDGYDDFIRQEKGGWAGDTHNTAQAYLSDGDGGFTLGSQLGNGLNGNTTNIIVGDFNGDGNDDFIRQEKGSWDNDSTGTAQVYLSDGDGTFTSQPLTDHTSMKGDLVNIIVGDFNGDGYDDFIRQEKGAWDDDSANTARVYYNSWDGTFYSSDINNNGDLFKGDLTTLTIGDFNGDGKDDFFAQKTNDYSLAPLYLSNGFGTFTPTFISGYFFERNSIEIVVGDFNGDGIDDFIRRGKNGNLSVPQVFLANGNGTFTNHLLPNHLKTATTNLIVGDYNGDGKDDFIRQEKGATDNDEIRTAEVYLSNGDGTFAMSPLGDIKGDLTQLVVADLNADGYDDFLGNGGQTGNKLLLGLSGFKVQTLSNSFAEPEVQSIATQTLAMGSLGRNNQDRSIAWNQRGTAYTLGSYGYSYLLLPALQSSARIAGTRAFAAMNSGVVGFGVIFAGEIISQILAKNGQSELAGYFGSANDPLIDVFELSNRQDLRASNDLQKVQLGLLDGLLYTGQVVLNVLTSPVSGILNFVNPPDPNPNANLGWNNGFSWQNKTNSGVQENRTLSIIGTNKNDVLQSPLYVNGLDGDDIIMGRMNRNNDKYIAYINFIANQVFFKGGTSANRAYYRAGNQDVSFYYHLDVNDIVSIFDYGGFQELPQGFTNNDQGWKNFLNTYRHELNQFFDSNRGNKGSLDHLKNYHTYDGFSTQLRGGAGDDKIYSRYDTDIYGDGGNDYIKANYYAEYIYGGADDDVIVLDANNDSSFAHATTYSYWSRDYYNYAYHTRRVDGGTGYDHLMLNGLYGIEMTPDPVLTNVSIPYTTDVFIEDDEILFRVTRTLVSSVTREQTFRTLNIRDFEQLSIFGTDRDNYLRADGSTMNVFLNGEAGNDNIFGSKGVSVLRGGRGFDKLETQGADDVLIGGYGSDTLTGGAGADVFVLDTFENDYTFRDIITDFSLVEGDIIAINLDGFGHLTESDLTRFQYRKGKIKFDGIEIVELYDEWVTDFSDFNLEFGKDIIFTNFWQNASDVHQTTLNGTVANGYIQGATVFLDANFNGLLDANEPSAITNELGQYNLNLDFNLYDLNGNGEIDPDEAQIVAVGGVDITTGLPLLTPFIATGSSGTIVSPLTTIKANLEQSGLSTQEAQELLAETLDLNEDLDEFNPYEANSEQHQEGVNTVLAHILLHSIMVNGSAFLEAAGYTGNSSEILTQVITDELLSGAEVELEEAETIDKLFTLALESVAIDSISTETVSNVAKLIGVLNDFMEDILEQEEEDDDDDDFSVANTVTDINPIKHLLLGELPELTTQLTTGEINLQQALTSLDADLREIGFKLILSEEIEDGELEIEYEVVPSNLPKLDPNHELLIGTDEVDRFFGTDEADIYYSLDGDDYILAQGGDDYIITGAGKDFLSGGDGDDAIDGGSGKDFLGGGTGNDAIDGGSGDDTINGGLGHDTIYGGDGNDTIFGSRGDDLIAGGKGKNTIYGGSGADTFMLQSGSINVIHDFVDGIDRLGLADGVTWEQLDIVVDGNLTLIQDVSRNTLAILPEVDSRSLNADDFMAI